MNLLMRARGDHGKYSQSSAVMFNLLPAMKFGAPEDEGALCAVGVCVRACVRLPRPCPSREPCPFDHWWEVRM